MRISKYILIFIFEQYSLYMGRGIVYIRLYFCVVVLDVQSVYAQILSHCTVAGTAVYTLSSSRSSLYHGSDAEDRFVVHSCLAL